MFISVQIICVTIYKHTYMFNDVIFNLFKIAFK